MDGNGRWARNRAMPRHAGHKAGVRPVRETIEAAARRGVGWLTLFAFSSENWNRPRDEVGRLMELFVESLRREVDELHQNSVRLRFVGDLSRLGDDLCARMRQAEQQTAGNDGLQLQIAVAYGGRWDIVAAARAIAGGVAGGRMQVADIDEEAVAGELQLAGLPDPDLLIRTGGEQRISNFLLWNLAYAELYFTDVLWPDFRGSDFDAALAHFARRQRRFGFTGEQAGAV